MIGADIRASPYDRDKYPMISISYQLDLADPARFELTTSAFGGQRSSRARGACADAEIHGLPVARAAGTQGSHDQPLAHVPQIAHSDAKSSAVAGASAELL